MDAYGTTYCEAIFVDGNLFDKVTATDAHFFFRQQVVHYHVCQMFPVLFMIFFCKITRDVIKIFRYILLFIDKYLKA